MAEGFNLKRSSTYSSRKKRTRSIHPMVDRNPFVPQYLGGSFGYRGGDWRKARLIALDTAGYISQITGFPNSFDRLQVDHIYPYRLSRDNRQTNLRVTNFQDNVAVDNIKGFDIPKDIRTRRF